MRLGKTRSSTQSLVASNVGLLFGVLAAFGFLRGTHHLAHFWPIAIILSVAFECTLLYRIEST